MSSSDLDSVAGDAVEECHSSGVGTSDEEEQVLEAKAMRGANVMWASGFFTCTNNPKFPNLKITIHPRWCVPGMLGTEHMSKTKRPAEFGETSAHPVRTQLVLRAWMVWRFAWCGFADSTARRRRWLERERAKLQRDVRAMGPGGTGNAVADAAIREWVPDAFG